MNKQLQRGIMKFFNYVVNQTHPEPEQMLMTVECFIEVREVKHHLLRGL